MLLIYHSDLMKDRMNKLKSCVGKNFSRKIALFINDLLLPFVLHIFLNTLHEYLNDLNYTIFTFSSDLCRLSL
jgi:hypothetical protein